MFSRANMRVPQVPKQDQQCSEDTGHQAVSITVPPEVQREILQSDLAARRTREAHQNSTQVVDWAHQPSQVSNNSGSLGCGQAHVSRSGVIYNITARMEIITVYICPAGREAINTGKVTIIQLFVLQLVELFNPEICATQY